ncbi:YeeE/YedE family protein [Candidatus Woesearchaeota archaeon]|nr:YeeE/YedE family protein [Candidatus Woesearchaeota archaeon]
MKLHYLVGGLLFGFGLAFSGMAKPEIVLSFLQLTDFGLLLVMGAAVLIVSTSYFLLPCLMRKPIVGAEFVKYTQPFDKRTVIGASIFGVGWGISGLCPGSALASLGMGNLPVFFGIAGLFLGAYIQGRIFGDYSTSSK